MPPNAEPDFSNSHSNFPRWHANKLPPLECLSCEQCSAGCMSRTAPGTRLGAVRNTSEVGPPLSVPGAGDDTHDTCRAVSTDGAAAAAAAAAAAVAVAVAAAEAAEVVVAVVSRRRLQCMVMYPDHRQPVQARSHLLYTLQDTGTVIAKIFVSTTLFDP